MKRDTQRAAGRPLQMTARDAMHKAIDAALGGRLDEAACWRSISTELRQFERWCAAQDDSETPEQSSLEGFDPDA